MEAVEIADTVVDAMDVQLDGYGVVLGVNELDELREVLQIMIEANN